MHVRKTIQLSKSEKEKSAGAWWLARLHIESSSRSEFRAPMAGCSDQGNREPIGVESIHLTFR